MLSGMATRRVTFESRRGTPLAAVLDTPDRAEVQATALLAHCFTCGKDLKGLRTLSRTLVEHGFAVLRFDFTGIGESGGEPLERGLGGDADDVEDAAAWLAEHQQGPSLLVGHSLGGLAAILAADRIASLRAVATIGTPSTPQHLEKLVSVGPDDIAPDASVETTLGGRRFRLPGRFFAELRARSPLACLHDLKLPLLVAHSVTDSVVSVQHAEALFRAARDPRAAYTSLGQADHLLSDEADARFAGRAIGGWAAAILDLDVAPHAATGTATETATGTAAETSAASTRLEDRTSLAVTEGGYATDAYAGGFPLRIDEPDTHGGTDTGPTPVELLRAALASCTSITLRMYADRKGWPLTRIEVEVTSSSRREGGVTRTHLERRIRLEGDLDEPQRARALEIADRCPVHRMLEGEVTIDTVEA